MFGERIEGSEWIISLRGPSDPNNASWMIRWLEGVQTTEDGVVVVVSPRKIDYERFSPPEFARVNAERVERPLTEYKRRARSAYMRFHLTTHGRIGTVKDVDGNPLPFLVEDASDAALQQYIGQIKVVEAIEFTPKSPPPVPGENDHDPAGLTINDIIATRGRRWCENPRRPGRHADPGVRARRRANRYCRDGGHSRTNRGGEPRTHRNTRARTDA